MLVPNSMTHRLAVYGTLKKNFPSNHFVANGKYLGYTFIKGALMISMGGFPGVCLVGGTRRDIVPNGVTVEIWDVDQTMLAKTDEYENHPDYFCRKEINVPTFGQCWIYTLDPNIWLSQTCDVVWDGDWKGPTSKTKKVFFGPTDITVEGEVFIPPSKSVVTTSAPWAGTSGYSGSNFYTTYNKDRDRQVTWPTSVKEP